ncbi:MAG: hypothetical protein II288_01025 [Alistipes sp.]|nr:hypothetical protein [Alistipes sp.]
MKKSILGLVLLFMVASFTSCTKEYITVAPTEDPDTSTYTVMMYGCGGRDLDASMVMNIQEALLEGATDRVNFTGQIKFSARYHQVEEFSGTQRFIVGEAGETWYEPVEVLDSNIKLYEPQNLTDFVNWSKQQCPADEYILILWNHGGAWLPSDDYSSDSRAIVYDDMYDMVGLTLDNLVKGVKDSNTKFKMIYFDACLMGMIEVISGLTDCAEYTMAASHVTPGIGGDYNSLIHHLDQSTNFEQSMKEYCRETVSHWEPTKMPLDLMVVNNSKVDALLNEISLLSGYLKDIAKIYANYDKVNDVKDVNKTNLYEAFKNAITSCYHYDWDYEADGSAHYPFYDILDFVELLSNGGTNTYSAKLVDISSRINRAFADVIVCKQLTAPISHKNLTMGITIIDKYQWKKQKYNPAYYGLVFQDETNWGNWLEINPVAPAGNPNPLTYYGNPEMGEEPILSLQEEIDYLLSLIGKK